MKKFGNPVFGPASNLAVVHEIILGGVGVKINHKTVQRWATGYAGLMDRYLDMIIPQVGEKWRTDETCIMIRGDCKYLFAMLGNDTGYWLAKMVAEHKGNDDIAPMFEAAKGLAKKIPARLVSDGAANFGHAHKKQCAPKNFFHKDSEHIRHIHMAGDTNNNQMESFNGNTYGIVRRSFADSRRTTLRSWPASGPTTTT